MSEDVAPPPQQAFSEAIGQVAASIVTALDAPVWPVGNGELSPLLQLVFSCENKLAALRLSLIKEADDRTVADAVHARTTPFWLAQLLTIDHFDAAKQVRLAREGSDQVLAAIAEGSVCEGKATSGVVATSRRERASCSSWSSFLPRSGSRASAIFAAATVRCLRVSRGAQSSRNSSPCSTSSTVTSPMRLISRSPSTTANALTLESRTAAAGLLDTDTGQPTAHLPGLTERGDRLAPATLRRLACDAKLVPVVLGSRGQPLDLGREVRLATATIYRALAVEFGGCCGIGCTAPPSQTTAHHMDHWADDGPTSLANSAPLCEHEHWLVHEGGWNLRCSADPGVVEWRPPAWIDPARPWIRREPPPR